MTNTIRFKRGTKAAIDSVASKGGLLEGEPLYFTDLATVGIATSPSTFSFIKSKVFLTAHLNANITPATGANLTNWTVLIDTSSSFNASSGIYTVPYSGIYRIHISALSLPINAGGGLSIKVNSTIRKRLAYTDSVNTYQPVVGEEFVELIKGDTVSITQTNNTITWFGSPTEPVGRLNIEMVY